MSTFKTSDRRKFMSDFGKAGLSLGFGRFFLNNSASANQISMNDKVVVFVHLSGGMDGSSLLFPKKGAQGKDSVARKIYEGWRPKLKEVKGIDAPRNPRAEPFSLNENVPTLRKLINAQKANILCGVAGAKEVTSHFLQQDLIHSGSESSVVKTTGFLGRAAQKMGLVPYPLARLSLQERSSMAFRATNNSFGLQSINIKNLSGELKSFTESESWKRPERIQEMYGCAGIDSLCAAGREASSIAENISSIDDLGEYGADESFPSQIMNLARFAKSEPGKSLKFVQMVLGGWDTHSDQEANFKAQASKLDAALSSIEQNFLNDSELKNRFVFYFYTEFGRTLRENGTRGTDHGYGSVNILVGTSLSGDCYKGIDKYYPEDEKSDFYKPDVLRMQKIIDIREVQSELLLFAGLSNLDDVFPGFTYSSVSSRRYLK